MTQNVVTCPKCRTRLRSDRPIPTGIQLNCPDCKVSFPSPIPTESAADLAHPPRLIGPGFVIGVSVAVILGAAIILAAVIVSQPTSSSTTLAPSSSEKNRLDDERQRLENDRRQVADQKRTLDHARLLVSGETALRQEKFAEAEAIFTRALELTPTDRETMKGLATAQAALAALKKTTDDDKNRQAEADRLLADAKLASADKKYAQAVRLLESARTLVPTSRLVLDALTTVQAALDADMAQAKTLADYRKLMDAAKASLIAERFTDAVRDYQAALRLMPEDLEAQQGVKQAEAKLAGVADKAKRQLAFDNFLNRARKAQTDTRFKDAIAAVESALKLMPDEREAMRLFRTASDSLKQAKSKNAKLLAQAETGLRVGRLDEAKRLADEAVKNWAEDTRAQKLLDTADRLIKNAQTVQAAYQRFMQQGALASAAIRYADAVTAYTEALRLVPNDATATRLLANAQFALTRNLNAGLNYNQFMKIGAAALARNAYIDAGNAFLGALNIVPNDIPASDGLSRARYGKAMVDGQQALRLRRRGDAIRAFEAALNELPNDIQANAGLRQAKLLR